MHNTIKLGFACLKPERKKFYILLVTINTFVCAIILMCSMKLCYKMKKKICPILELFVVVVVVTQGTNFSVLV